jgi:putative chitinase
MLHAGAHWTADLNLISEGGDYPTPARAQAVFSRRFPTPESTLPYLHNPQKMLNHVYRDQPGNGPEESGDGYR